MPRMARRRCSILGQSQQVAVVFLQHLLSLNNAFRSYPWHSVAFVHLGTVLAAHRLQVCNIERISSWSQARTPFMAIPLSNTPGPTPPNVNGSGTGRDPLSIPTDVKASIKILLVDDERTLRESCASVLQMDGFSVTLAGRGAEAVEMVRRRKFDIVLVDLYRSQVSGLEILRAALEAHRDTIVVVMTGNPSVTSSIEALRAGAWDYLPKPFSATHLQVLIGRASHAVMMGREADELRQQVLHQNSHSDSLALIGISPLFRKAVDLARKVAPTDASVFISGESGTGKEVIAQFIHQHSRRDRKPMVAINC